jgi:hypothetical protein
VLWLLTTFAGAAQAQSTTRSFYNVLEFREVDQSAQARRAEF